MGGKGKGKGKGKDSGKGKGALLPPPRAVPTFASTHARARVPIGRQGLWQGQGQRQGQGQGQRQGQGQGQVVIVLLLLLLSHVNRGPSSAKQPRARLRVPLFLPPLCILRDIPARREGSVFVDAHCSMLAQCWSLAYSATHSTLHPGRRHLPSRAVVQEDAPVLARATVQETPVTTASSLSTARKVTDRSQLRIAPSQQHQ